MKKGDYILIVLLILVSVGSFFFMRMPSSGAGKTAIVKVDGQIVKEIPFTQENVGKHFVIESKYGRNVVEMEADRVHVIEADCPDKLDVKQGYIEREGEMIVCLPNRMTIEIREDKDDLDAVVH